jgi:hypothetical protein
MVAGFIAAAWRLGDWRNWPRYYPSVLFVMVVNLSAGYLSYHHSLWNYSGDILVTTQTIVEFINTYINLPATVLVYLSHFPSDGKVRKLLYGGMWVMIYGTFEYLDHYVFGGMLYTNNWSWFHSLFFDIVMFYIIRIHYLNPLTGWLLSFLVALFVITQYGFLTAEMK